MIRIFLTLILFCAGFVYLYFEKKVTKIELPEGELKWSYVKPKNAKMCIPAAFTEKDRKKKVDEWQWISAIDISLQFKANDVQGFSQSNTQGIV